MLTFLPKPKFAVKWKINIQDAPKDWENVIENAVLWALAVEKRLRDEFIIINIKFVSNTYYEKILEKLHTKKLTGVARKFYCSFPPSHNTHLDKKQNYKEDVRYIHLGQIVCNGSVLFKQALKEEIALYELLVRVFVDLSLDLLQLKDNEFIGARRKVLTKFSLC